MNARKKRCYAKHRPFFISEDVTVCLCLLHAKAGQSDGGFFAISVYLALSSKLHPSPPPAFFLIFPLPTLFYSASLLQCDLWRRLKEDSHRHMEQGVDTMKHTHRATLVPVLQCCSREKNSIGSPKVMPNSLQRYFQIKHFDLISAWFS